ncbi:MAG: tRNA glutamyl-Q(34) synthetase GluQRS [Treponema sp.]|nr:tRNA glutamyl-Q(34) synthetase GluQRS [Treponema sp.]
MSTPALKGRFAPSPSGRMHIGNVYAALMSWLSVRARGGSWLLRIEDLDRQRCRREYAETLMDDLRWLGLTWDEGGTDSYFQSARDEVYQQAFSALKAQGRIYDCFCRRADLLAASAPHASDGTPVYSGRCRALSQEDRLRLASCRAPASRIQVPDKICSFTDGHYGVQTCNLLRDCGDFIVRRADGNFAYQLAVVVDDACMGVTEVVRGRDLLASTHQQLFLYDCLGLTPPEFRHLPLLTGADGRRLSKRDKDTDMAYLRSVHTPEEIIGLVMFLCGFTERRERLSLDEALSLFDWQKLPVTDIAAEACAVF